MSSSAKRSSPGARRLPDELWGRALAYLSRWEHVSQLRPASKALKGLTESPAGRAAALTVTVVPAENAVLLLDAAGRLRLRAPAVQWRPSASARGRVQFQAHFSAGVLDVRR